MYCKNCGNQLADDAKFCTSCGTKQDQIVIANNSVNQPPGPNYGNVESGHNYITPDVNYTNSSDYPSSNLVSGKIDNSTMLLLGFTGVYFLVNAIVEIMRLSIEDWYAKPFYYLVIMLFNVIPLLIPLAIKKTQYKIVALVLTAPWVLYYLYHNVKNLIECL